MYASLSTASMRSASVTKYADRYPRSNCMPSTTSRLVSVDFASSMVTTPSLPTFSIASAISLPMVWSPLALMMPTCSISFRFCVGLDCRFRSATTAATAASMPRLSPSGWPRP